MTTSARNIGRIDVWPSQSIARDADTSESKLLQRMTIWPTRSAARAHLTQGGGGGGGSPYAAKAVHFDGPNTSLWTPALAIANSDFCSYSFWYRQSAPQAAKQIWTFDPANMFASYCYAEDEYISTLVSDSAGSGAFQAYTDDALEDDEWVNVTYSCDTNHQDGEKIGKYYIDGVASIGTIVDGRSAHVFDQNGVPFFLGDDSFGDGATFDIADFRLDSRSWLVAGDIPEATRLLFRDVSGKPVDPAVATAALGAPAVLFSGDETAFLTNQGTGGAFTLTGSLTNATTSPSD